MAEHHQEYPVATMCRVLEVSVSGYYAWRKREPSLHSREDAELANKIKGAFQSNRCVYGSPRIHAELHAQGIHCARKRIARLMRELNACTLNLRNHIYLAALKPDAKPREAEAHSAISRWKHIELVAKRPRHRTVTTKSEEGAKVTPNLLQQDFHADQPNQKWASDTTYIWTQEGWLYLAARA